MNPPELKFKKELLEAGVQSIDITTENGDIFYGFNQELPQTTIIKIKIHRFQRNKKQQKLLDRFIRKMTLGWVIYPHKKRG